MTPPLVTVVIPTHGQARVLPRAVSSVLGQTFVDFELVVVDDGSTDETPAVVAAFADPRIQYVRRGQRGGPARARNAGIRDTRGELVAFLDSDDEWLPAKLERQVARLREARDPASGLVYCGCARYDHAIGRRFESSRRFYEGDVFESLLAGWHPPTASVVLVRRSALETVGGFDEAIPYAEDYDCWLRLAEHSVRFLAVPEVLVVKHDNEGPQLSADADLRDRSLRLLTARWGPVIQSRLGPSAYRHWYQRRRVRTQTVRYEQLVQAVAQGQRRLGAWRHVVAIWMRIPGSRLALRALALVLLGPRLYRAMIRARDVLSRGSTP